MGSSYSLPALDVRQPQNPLDEFARIFQVRGLQQSQQLQQGQIQEQQLQLQDDQKWRDAMARSDWDGSPEQLLKNGLKAGVGPQSYAHVAQSLASLGEATAKFGSEQLKTQQALNDHIANQLQAVDDAPDENKLAAQQQAKANAISWITSTPGIHPAVRQQMLQGIQKIPDDSYIGDDAIEGLIGQNKLHSALVEEGLKTAQTQEAAGKANQAQTEAALGQIKLNLSKNSKPGDFDAQIDQLAPANGPMGPLNQQMKAMVNPALARGDFEGAQKILQDGFNQVGAINKETNPQVIAARAQGAAQTAAIVEPLRQQILVGFQNNKDARDKIESSVLAPFQQKQSAIDEARSAVAQAAAGNIASARATLYKVIGVAQPQGAHRVAPTEVTGFSGMGSISERVAGSIANALSGDPWTPQMVQDIGGFLDGQSQVNQGNLSRGIQNVNKLYGTNVGQGLIQGGGGGGNQNGNTNVRSGPPPGATHQVLNRADGKMHWTDAQNSRDYGVAQ